ncbi:hypothetical protein BJ878DRAFT_535141 [Calycina marina]|uniref:RRM domain-containing protein n=1 Tax=Calycina marina TaxID=1763456 RepID=A0A9P8CFP4_9HELO|nr:hypothetical protein BJ878DRAFT_535141 [Calycina marina]
MASRSLSRGRSPYSEVSRGRSRSVSRPRRSATPRSRSPSPRNGGYRSGSRSISRDRSPTPVKSTKIVVERISKNVNIDHLKEIFGIYGPIRDLDMPVNRTFGTNRGTAYVLYENETDSEAAIAHMHESQIDGCTINVSIVLPRRKFSPSPPMARRGANLDSRAPPPGRFRGPPPPQRRATPTSYRNDRNSYNYRPRSLSRSNSPAMRRHRTRSRSYTRSRSPPRRGRGGARDSPVGNGGYRDRRRSMSYSSYSSYDDRSRSRSRGRGPRGVRR